MEMESLSLNAGIAMAIAVGVLFIAVIVLAVVAFRNWKALMETVGQVSENIKELQGTTAETNDALKKTNEDLQAVTDEVHQNDERWLEHQRNMMFTRHQVFLSEMDARLSEMVEETKINGARGVLDEKDVARVESGYKSALAVIRNLLKV